MKKPSDYYDEFSARYDRGRHRGYHALIDELETGCVVPLAAGGRVLEAGCGTGLILRRVGRAASSLFGADLSLGMLGSAARGGFRVVQADIRRLPFKTGSFDLVYSFKVLAHVKDAKGAIEEMARVTKPGGWVCPELYNRLSLRHLVRVLKGARRISDRTTDREVYTRYDTLKEILGMVPPSCRLEGVRGVRIWTPLPFLLKIPVLGHLLAALERVSADGPLARFAGFVILKMRKTA